MKAQPWWPETTIYWTTFLIGVGVCAMDLSGHLCCASAPKLLPASWEISRYELDVMYGAAALVVGAMVIGLRRFEFDGSVLSVGRLFVPRSRVEIPLTEIASVSGLLPVDQGGRVGAHHYFGLKRVDGRDIKVPARYAGAMQLVAAIQSQLASRRM